MIFTDEGRPRTLWRLVGFTTLWLLISTLFGIVLAVVVPIESLTVDAYNLIGGWATLLSLLLAVLAARRWFDRRPFVDLGLVWNRQGGFDLAAGIGIAGLMMALVFVVELALGWIRIETLAWQVESPFHWISDLVVMLHFFILVGVYEELLMRGYLLQNLRDGLNLKWAFLLSSVIFAIFHAVNPGYSPLAWVGLLAAGLFLASAYARTRQLWLPIGLHIGWNFFLGPVFGFPVSGKSFAILFQQVSQGPAWLTGGEFGPEGGLILLPALVLGFLLVWGYGRRNQSQS